MRARNHFGNRRGVEAHRHGSVMLMKKNPCRVQSYAVYQMRQKRLELFSGIVTLHNRFMDGAVKPPLIIRTSQLDLNPCGYEDM